ncbi:hypothetical protein EWM64_g4992 [Hericium alpestre]|uniref:Uncharacterized protein n=1 Tax=Hericium alpestre TaxID=135208 RepID=A0A4Y9ZXV7_9AGAM|nr:hypothetical protein EWM64_g4992 [Hericium alpestre]
MSAKNEGQSSMQKRASTAVAPFTGPAAPEPIFDKAHVTACESLVKDYRSSRIAKPIATLQIMRAIHEKPASEITGAQQNIVFLNYFEMLEDHDQDTCKAAERAKQPSPHTKPGPPDNASKHEDDEDDDTIEQDLRVPAKRKLEVYDERSELSGRQKLDKSLIPFAATDTCTICSLGTDLRETLHLKENYTRNLEGVRQIAISSPTVPEFPQALWKDVLANNFVNLDKVLSGEYTISGDPKVIEKFSDTGLSISLGEQKPSCAVSNHGEWTIAWGSYQ